ncbi:methyl-accepting chemotaxis sensory transducer [Aeromonas sp. RU39B]|uniref:methyl-accepting chemotaxis protein n=1 Tax=Aeromonas sp. RU39B TaxID=1907416 RepID=UPI000954056E|nr:methyl-accepting chemotaxis protein [Aeromonas sp. RU39B]SIQ76001.1 methyl-accepting chemotaxis sensory transducer [Aeromonas sp. RU39B]
MKEVKTGWIDRYLIRLTLGEKCLVALAIPLLAMVVLTINQLGARHEQMLALETQALQQRVETAASLLSQQSGLLLPADLQLQQGVARGVVAQGELVRVEASAGKAGMVVGTLDEASIPDGWSASLMIQLGGLVLITLMVGVVLTRHLGGSVVSTKRTLQAIASGDLTVRMRFNAARDELVSLASSIDQSTERQHRIVQLVDASADALGLAADEFREHASEGQALARSQRQRMDSLAAAMDQMSAAIRDVAHNAGNTLSQTRESSDEAARGAARVSKTIDAIRALADEVTHASGAVEELTANASRINEVVSVINAISQQTNLLALNAAIEAARAGEQGRGFAVVADEVRTLAGRTQQATVEIQQMLETLQQGTSTLNDIMEQTVVRAAESRDLISQVGDDIDRISQHSAAVFAMSEQIATSSEEQSSVAADVSRQLDQVRRESVEVEESASAAVAGTQGLKATATELAQALQGLRI